MEKKAQALKAHSINVLLPSFKRVRNSFLPKCSSLECTGDRGFFSL